jgi:titin
MEATSGMFIQGNLSVQTRLALHNWRGSYGVRLMATRGGNLVGGTEPDAGNLISGSDEGFSTTNGPQGAPAGFDRVQGNFIGTNVTGTASIPNRYGVRLTGSAGGLIGGADADDGSLDGVVRARNIISGNEVFGIWLAGSGFTIQGNFIGTDITGVGPLGNGGSGIDSLSSFANANIGGNGVASGKRSL